MTATQSKWADRVREWQASGRTAPDYARGRGFAASTLVWWSSRIRCGALGDAVASTTSGSSIRMARVVRARRSSGTLRVTVGGTGIEVGPGFDPGLLREVVEALGGAR